MKDIIVNLLPDNVRSSLKPLWHRWKHRSSYRRRTSLEKPIFIVGHPRSGTSWLNKLIVSHPNLAGGPETQLFNYYLRPFFDTDPFVPWGGVNQWVGSEGRRQIIRNLCDDIFAFRLAEEQKKRVVEKTPEHALFLHEIMSIYPAAKFIHVVRDGRDVMLSVFAYASHLSNPPKTEEEAAARWVSMLESVEAMKLAHPNSVCEVRYEDIASDPKSCLRQMFSFVEEKYTDGIIERIVGQHPPSKQSIGKWKTAMAPEHVRIYEEIARSCLRKWEYEIVSADLIVP